MSGYLAQPSARGSGSTRPARAPAMLLTRASTPPPAADRGSAARFRSRASARFSSRLVASAPSTSRVVLSDDLSRGSTGPTASPPRASSDASDAASSDAASSIDAEVASMVDVDALREMITGDPDVARREREMASAAKAAASLRVDAERDSEASEIAREMGTQRAARSSALEASRAAALADLEAKSAALVAAEAELADAARARAEIRAETGAAAAAGDPDSLSAAKWGSTVPDDVDEDAERLQSAKAALVSAVAGTLLTAPLLLSQSGASSLVALESVGGVFVSCLVFGVTYRYALRDDLGNRQLKGGVVGAFGLARGLGAADVYLHGSDAGAVASWAEAALLAGEAVLTFALAGAALEVAFEKDVLKPFPMKKKS